MKRHKSLLFIGFFLIIIYILSILKCNAQLSLQFRAGIDAHINNPFLAIAPHLSLRGFGFSPELIINAQNDKPVDFGLKMSYKYKFVEAGFGRYREVYSTDKYDSYKNGWANLFYGAVFYKQYFFEADYIHGMRYGIGVRASLN